MMGTAVGYHRSGCARLLHAGVHQECHSKALNQVHVEASPKQNIWVDKFQFFHQPDQGRVVPRLFDDTTILSRGAIDDPERAVQDAIGRCTLVVTDTESDRPQKRRKKAKANATSPGRAQPLQPLQLPGKETYPEIYLETGVAAMDTKKEPAAKEAKPTEQNKLP
eukprot:COSAG02_NODE_33914_length_492_cov_1.048346_1_plen_164_part_11